MKSGDDLSGWIPVSQAKQQLSGAGRGRLSKIANNTYSSKFVDEAKKDFAVNEYVGLNEQEITPTIYRKT